MLSLYYNCTAEQIVLALSWNIDHWLSSSELKNAENNNRQSEQLDCNLDKALFQMKFN